MTVYADTMRGYLRTERSGGAGRWSHLLADDPDELAAFAARLGLHPGMLQSPGTPFEHYDVVEAVRRRAVAAGAVAISYPYDTSNVIATKGLQASALDAARRGWHVFPLRPGAKTPAVKDWEHAATANSEQIRRLWTVRLQPGGPRVFAPRNVGIACGPSGLVVIDLDLAKPDEDRSRWPEQWKGTQITSGAAVLAALAGRAGLTVPDTYAVSTASGGQHLYFAAPNGMHLRNSARQLGPLVDVRGEGGYVVAAGSQLHPTGHEYSTTVTGDLAYRTARDIPPVDLPPWLTDVAAASRDREQVQATARAAGSTRDSSNARSDAYGCAAMRGEADRMRSAPVGQRNHTLNSAAYRLGQLVAAGALDHARAVKALTDAAKSVGLGPAETLATINSGISAGIKWPRGVPGRQSAPDESSPGQRVGVADHADRADSDPSPVDVTPGKSEGTRDQPAQSLWAGHGLEGARPPRSFQPDDMRTHTATNRGVPHAPEVEL